MSWWSPPVLRTGSCYDLLGLASVSFVVSAMWPNRERRRAWTIADRRGCPVVRLTSSFRTWWYHLIPNSFRKHHWSRASILSTSLGDCPALRAIQEDRWNAFVIQLQLGWNGCSWLPDLSGFCIAARVMALRREISGELWVVDRTRELWTKLSLCQKHKWKVWSLNVIFTTKTMLVFLQPLRHSQWMLKELITKPSCDIH